MEVLLLDEAALSGKHGHLLKMDLTLKSKTKDLAVHGCANK